MNIHAHNSAEPMSDFAALRRTMVDCQIRTFDVTDHAVIARFLEVPREKFVPIELRELAYSDIALKIRAAKPGGEARVLLPPMILARLVQGADVKPEDKVLDIASGTGYSTAILAELAKEVVTLNSEFGAHVDDKVQPCLHRVQVSAGRNRIAAGWYRRGGALRCHSCERRGRRPSRPAVRAVAGGWPPHHTFASYRWDGRRNLPCDPIREGFGPDQFAYLV